MRAFQLVMTAFALIAMISLFGMSFWIKANFSKGIPIATCYMPMTVITTVLVLISAITVFIRK